MSQSEIFTIENTFGVSGRVTPVVVDAKSGAEIKRYPTQRNIILDSGINLAFADSAGGDLPLAYFHNLIAAGVAGTGTTPTKDITSSSYTQTGTTVTRAGGSFAFTSGMIGRRIVFSDGQQAKITAVGSSTSATVDVSQTVPKAERPKTITSISSTATDFTVLATAHGLRVGDRITISGASVSGYNATWTVDVVNNAGSFTVNETSNFGAATGGTFVKAACLAALFRTDRTALATYVSASTTLPVFVDPVDGRESQCTIFNSTAKSVTLRRTMDFAEEASNKNYTEIGIGQNTRLWAIILLAGAVTVEAGQLLRVIYDLEIVHGGPPSEQPVITEPIAGWPRPYNVSSITSTGSAFTVTLSESHHYKAGGKITLSGIRKPRFAITAATSTATEFTITAPGHTFSGGNVIAIDGMTPTGYNGTFTIASVAGDNIVVTSTLNPGTGTVFGTVRINEPQATAITGITSGWDTFTITAPGHGLSGSDVITVKGVTPNGYNGAWTVASVSGDDIVVNDTRNLGAGTGGTVNERNQVWYDDEWTIASVGSTTVVVNSTLNLGTVNTNEGTATNNVRRKLLYAAYGIAPVTTDGSAFAGLSNIYFNTIKQSSPQIRAIMGHSNSTLLFGGSGELKQNSGSSYVLPLMIVGDTAPVRPTRWPVYYVNGTADYLLSDPVNFPQETGLTEPNYDASRRPSSAVWANYTAGSFLRDIVYTWGTAVGNALNIRGISFMANSTSEQAYFIDFEEPQRKDATHKLTLTMRRRITRNLTVDTPT